ncbi:DUF1682-domain-containing protein [Rickenella mellea]|uniref:DUF1682-domain-containing protein n=1 Tax=Rickenella mellea TaxID=50990 RepID=A0A4R5XH00_9AGAM|nr:DUF1682-domain-containing protein [Rickenella mellea]
MAAQNFVLNLLKFLTPPPVFTGPDYDGLEYRWKVVVFRPALFKVEAFLILGVIFYIAAFFVGKSANAKRANAWLNSHFTLLSQQFSSPTFAGLVPDGYSDFFNFSTGRRGVASLHTVFALMPRHDLLQMLFMFGRSLIELNYNPTDEVELDFKLSSTNTPGFVWAVVAKDELSKVKDGRWDLTFTKTTENPQLGSSFSVMSEFADVTENILKISGGTSLQQVLGDPAFKPYFRSLSVTDQPRERPALPIPSEFRERHVILSLRAPPSSKAGVTVPLVKAVFSLIDVLDTKLNLRPETKTKLRKTREEMDDELRKEADAEKKEEAELQKQNEKRKAEEERISKLSASEQKKVLERDRKRAIRKSQGKMTVKK